MANVQRFCAFGFAAFAAIFCIGIEAQQGDPAAIQQKLVSQIKLTKSTADRTDIVTAGDVLVLQKDGLTMCSSDSSYAFGNTYSNGAIVANYNNRAKDAAKSYGKAFGLSRLGLGGGRASPTRPTTPAKRESLSLERSFGLPGLRCARTGS